MNPPGVDPVALATLIRDADPDASDRDGLAQRVRDVAVLRAWCDAEQVRNTRAQRRLAAEGRGESPKDLLATEAQLSGREARAGDERERVCTTMPGFETALSSGLVSAGHVDAVAASVRTLDESERAEFASHTDELVADAATLSVDAFERECRDLARLIRNTAGSGDSAADELTRQQRMSKVSRWTDPDTGMRNTLITCDPIRDATLWTAIDAARRELRRRGTGNPDWQQLQVDAVIHAATKGAGVTGGVLMLIDHRTLLEGLHERSVYELPDGTPIPVSIVRQVACEAGIIPIVLAGDGRALDVGRTQRLATEAQRFALLAMYTTCGFPGCTVPADQCEMHHVVPWENGGPTDLSNLLPLCLVDGHHHLVHEGGWALTMTPDRTVTVRRPDGSVWFEGPTTTEHPTASGHRRSLPETRSPNRAVWCEAPAVPGTDTGNGQTHTGTAGPWHHTA